MNSKTYPLWWAKWWRAIAAIICEALWIFNLPMPTKRLRDDYGYIAEAWCCHIHSALEIEVIDYDGAWTARGAMTARMKHA